MSKYFFRGKQHTLDEPTVSKMLRWADDNTVNSDKFRKELSGYDFKLPVQASSLPVEELSDSLSKLQSYKDRVTAMIDEASQNLGLWEDILEITESLKEQQEYNTSQDEKIQAIKKFEERNRAINNKIPETISLWKEATTRHREAKRLLKNATDRLANLESANRNFKYQFKVVTAQLEPSWGVHEEDGKLKLRRSR